MIQKEIEISELQEVLGGLSYALIYSAQGIVVDKIENIDQSILSEAISGAAYESSNIMEARFFDSNKEVHIFFTDELHIVLSEEESNDNLIESSYELANKYGKGTLKVKRVMTTDSDGQTVISSTRLAGLEE